MKRGWIHQLPASGHCCSCTDKLQAPHPGPRKGDLFQLIGGSDDEQASKKPEKADKPGKQPDNAEACKMQTG